MTRPQSAPQELVQVRKWAISFAIAGAIASAAGLLFSPQQFFRSYLMAYLYWLSIGLGCLPLLMLYHLVGGAWGFAIRRYLESGTRTIVVLAVLFIPVLAGVRRLYPWIDPADARTAEAVLKKNLYLNIPFFIGRAVLFFLVWYGFIHLLNKWSARQDDTADLNLMRKFARLSGPGLTLYGLTFTFAAIDWAMSLEPRWYSTVYGMLWMVDTALSALAFAIVILAFLPASPLKEAGKPGTLHDLGNLLLAFLMLWGYLSFAQLLITWSGNLPEEISWYLSRLRNGWQWVAAGLISFHFFVPFFLLLSRSRKKDARTLGYIALLVLGMRIIDTFWMIVPAFYPRGFSVHWLDPIALAAIGGIWMTVYATQLGAQPLLPLNDPNAGPHKTI